MKTSKQKQKKHDVIERGRTRGKGVGKKKKMLSDMNFEGNKNKNIFFPPSFPPLSLSSSPNKKKKRKIFFSNNWACQNMIPKEI